MALKTRNRNQEPCLSVHRMENQVTDKVVGQPSLKTLVVALEELSFVASGTVSVDSCDVTGLSKCTKNTKLGGKANAR